MNKASTQELMIEAAINCIEKYGIDQTTTRKIAEMAGTNIAAINYYFRSKDELIQQALAVSLEHMAQDLVEIAGNLEMPFKQMLHDWIAYIVLGGLEFPNISMAHLYAPLVEKADSQAKSTFQEMRDHLSQRAVRAYPEKDPNELNESVSIFLSAILFTTLVPDFLVKLDKSNAESIVQRFTALFFRMIQ